MSFRAPSAVPLLVALSMVAAGTVPRPAPAAEPLFVERASQLGLDFVHWNGMTGRRYFAENMGAGVALVDFDGDGDLDVYLLQGASLGTEGVPVFSYEGPEPPTDRLFRNDLVRGDDGRPTPRFVDVTSTAGLAGEGGATGYGFGVAVGDPDGDGDPDLYVTNLGEGGASQLWRNRGDGTFEEVAAAAGVAVDSWAVPAVFFDPDGDGDQDLFVGSYVRYSTATDRSCPDLAGVDGVRDYCGPGAYTPATNRLFENRGDGTFSDRTVAWGLATAAPGRTLGAVALDFDGDGIDDLYVANDMTANELWISRPVPSGDGGDGGRRLVDEALLAGAGVNVDGEAEASMGIAPGDVTGDGLEDLLVTHLDGETHTLYVAQGGGLFSDRTTASRLAAPTLPMTGFGALLEDFDGDGHLDLLVTDGAVRNLPDQVRAGEVYPLAQRDQLFLGSGDGRFEEVPSARAGEAFERLGVGRGAAAGDLDEDGDPDVVVTVNSGAAKLLVNESSETSWLALVVPVGTRVELGGQVRRAHTDGSYASASDPRVRFRALGEGGATLRVLEKGPGGIGGRTLEIRDAPRNRTLVISPPFAPDPEDRLP
jgi:hypothetical protein